MTKENFNSKGSTLSATGAWGRESTITIKSSIAVGSLLFITPLMVTYFWASLDQFNGSLFAPIFQLIEMKPTFSTVLKFGLNMLPKFSWDALYLYLGWVAFNILAYLFFPSQIGKGQKTPAGHELEYRVNGFRIWIFTHITYVVFSIFIPLFDPAIIAKNWGGLLVATNIYGFALTFFSYIKAHLFPTHPEDRKFSGSWIYDLFMGIELNPRIGDLDFKLFHNGRPGIGAWTLINFSFAAAQYQKLGYVTNSMILLNFLHAIYVVDFFYFEDWYLRTIDIAHDHFGFYLAWGDSVWLPFMYTLQSHYLLKNTIILSNKLFLFLLVLGIYGYYIFRNVNNQKDETRKADGKNVIWGKPARVIRAKYTTSDGKNNESILLTSGYWGISRHFNYVGDLMMCLAFCCSCGFEHILPHFYFFYMAALLLHRVQRDHNRCKGKYGKYWDDYCSKVPYKVIPYVY